MKYPDHSDQWSISYDGKQVTLDSRSFDVVISPFIKSWCANQLAIRAPRTTEYYLYGLKQVSLQQFTAIITATPQEVHSAWRIISADQLQYYALEALKSIFSFMCRFSVGPWLPEWLMCPCCHCQKLTSTRACALGMCFSHSRKRPQSFGTLMKCATRLRRSVQFLRTTSLRQRRSCYVHISLGSGPSWQAVAGSTPERQEASIALSTCLSCAPSSFGRRPARPAPRIQFGLSCRQIGIVASYGLGWTASWSVAPPHPYFVNKILVFFDLWACLRCKILKTI